MSDNSLLDGNNGNDNEQQIMHSTGQSAPRG